MALDTAQIRRAADLLDEADGLIIAAGAGMGVDSGLPDFRGNEGFWKAYPALGRSRMDFARIASPVAFERDPGLAWGFYGHRLALYRSTRPHAGFGLLRAWGEAMPQGCRVFTSNVDGQFQRAGFDPAAIYECHGSIHHLQCMDGCESAIWEAESFAPEVDQERCRLLNEAPRCPHCGGLARPNILMFGDGGWIERRSAQQARRLEAWLEMVERPLVIELGAGTAVPSVRYFSQGIVARGGRLVRINPREPEVANRRDAGIAAGALEGLQAIAALRAQT
ncbi:SIR2 family NAD-dependent protein deacylase [Massilia endophytica]|uniref:SIR2 family NAD-dependent protein deacylase n=1 Tax=Massilia endophytica TaxID=2899220 RepID=UPI001E653ACF|nr:Sir2 family NAD-dependent protein deacetylase [Massilia endophytica]UGQ44986.1 NAD-dependent deacetylase [Massilia endophytica]